MRVPHQLSLPAACMLLVQSRLSLCPRNALSVAPQAQDPTSLAAACGAAPLSVHVIDFHTCTEVYILNSRVLKLLLPHSLYFSHRSELVRSILCTWGGGSVTLQAVHTPWPEPISVTAHGCSMYVEGMCGVWDQLLGSAHTW